MIVTDVATNKRETTDMVHVIAEEPDRAYAPTVLSSRTLTYLLYGLFYALLTKRRLRRNKYIIVFAFRAHFHFVF